MDKARKLQRALYRAAKSQPQRRFTILYDKVCDIDILREAWKRDRVAQMAVKIVIEPLFEADFKPCSYGFRPKRTPRMALNEIAKSVKEGYTHAVCRRHGGARPHGGGSSHGVGSS
jgi:retron-type reverse transcriptase